MCLARRTAYDIFMYINGAFVPKELQVQTNSMTLRPEVPLMVSQILDSFTGAFTLKLGVIAKYYAR